MRRCFFLPTLNKRLVKLFRPFSSSPLRGSFLALELLTGLGEKSISEVLRIPENHSESNGKELIALVQNCIFFTSVDFDYLVFIYFLTSVRLEN